MSNIELLSKWKRSAPKWYLLLLALTGLSACEDVLDKRPLGQLDIDAFFTDPGDAIQAVNTAYQPLLFNSANNNFYWAFGTVASDEAIVGGDGSQPGIVELDFFTYTPRTQQFNDFWRLGYNGITQANVVLRGLEKATISQELQNRIRGEALFLRGYYHFLLAQVFGPVPVMTEIKAPDELRVPRNPLPEVYAQIVADAEEAAALLPAQHDAGNVGRATRGAALALAAKTHLYNRNWNGVLEKVQQIKDLGIYALMPDYQDNFREDTQNNAESVWEIQHTNLELGVGNSLNQWWASRKFGTGYGFAEVTPEFIAAFEPGDPRRRFTLASNNEEYFGLIYKPSFSSTGHSPRKFLQSDSTATQKADGDINYPAIRYAEVLLWEAEALAELGRTAEALVPLEQVRARARAQADDPTTALPQITTTDQAELINLIRHERQVELGFEMHRFFDLVRWGLAEQVLDGFEPNKHEYFPIPQIELDLNPALTQNAGY